MCIESTNVMNGRQMGGRESENEGRDACSGGACKLGMVCERAGGQASRHEGARQREGEKQA